MSTAEADARAAAIETGVGPVVQVTALGRAVVEAIEAHNEGVVTDDAGAYIRVWSPNKCVVTKGQVEEVLGRDIRWPGELEVILSSFSGKVSMTDAGAAWWLAHEPQPEIPSE